MKLLLEQKMEKEIAYTSEYSYYFELKGEVWWVEGGEGVRWWGLQIVK